MIKVLTGENNFALQAALHRLVSDFVSEHGDLALEKLDGEVASYAQVYGAVISLPFLAGKKLVIVHRPAALKELTEQIESIAGAMSETTDVVFVEPKFDKRSSFYKWAKKHLDMQEFQNLDERSLATWSVELVKSRSGKLSLADATYLIQRVGLNQQRVSNELEKLLLSGDAINRESIDTMTESTPQSKIFDLLDAAFNGQRTRAMALYEDQRKQKVEPQEILAMIGWQLRQVALAKTAGTKHDLVREARMSPYSATKAKRIADRLTLAELKRLVNDLTVLDAKSKRTPIDLDQALKQYIITLNG